MPVVLNSNQLQSPGIYVIEDAVGTITQALAPFNRCYMMGTSTTGTPNVPTQVLGTFDFTNNFGSSDAFTLNNLNFWFNNAGTGNPGVQLWFTKVAIAQVATVTISTLATGAYTVTINGTAITFTAGASPTAQAVIDGLINAINNNTTVNTAVKATTFLNAAGSATYAGSNFQIYSLNPSNTFTLAATTGNLTVTAPAVPATANSWDYIYTLKNAFTDDMPQGFLVAPGAFYNATNQTDRTAVANQMETLCVTDNFDWVAYVDAGAPALVANPTAASTEAQLYTSTKGHTSYFYPYLVDTSSNDISPALAAAVVALRRYAAEGFNQPPAGTLYPLRGVSGLKYNVTKVQQAAVNPNGVNCFKYIPNIGVVLFGSRTRSISPYYTFINIRVIFNVLNRTIFNTLYYGGYNFQAVDGPGVLFGKIKAAASAICYQLWAGGALYGATPGDAYAVICDSSNNPNYNIEQGIVRVDVYAAPAGTSERIFVGTHRVPIGQVGISAGLQ